MKKFTRIKEIKLDNNIKITENKGDCEHLYALGEFLYYGVNNSFSYNFITSWLKGELNNKTISGNSYKLIIDENNEVIIQDKYTNYTQKKYKNLFFKTSKKHLLEIMDDWLRATMKASRPLNALITQEDDGSITFTAFDSQGNEITVKKEATRKERFFSFFNKLKKKFFNHEKK